jgi:hypothetical protein
MLRSLWPGWGQGDQSLRKRETDASARLFEGLYKITFEIAQPLVREALFREVAETAKTGATAWLSEAESLLQEILADPHELKGIDKEELRRTLSTVLQGDIPLPDGEEIHKHTHDLARMTTSAWLEILLDSLSERSFVELTEDFLPPREAVHPEFWQAFKDTIAPFAINPKEAAQIRISLREKIFSREHRAIALPLTLCLQREGSWSRVDCLRAMHQPDDRNSRFQLINETLQLFDTLSAGSRQLVGVS